MAKCKECGKELGVIESLMYDICLECTTKKQKAVTQPTRNKTIRTKGN